MGRRRLLCARHPILYHLSVFQKRLFRYLWWFFGGVPFALTKGERLRYTICTHRSLLIRKLAGTDQQLQLNKVANLKIAVPLINGVLIGTGDVFSFWRLVGKPSSSRGFLPGLQLSMGQMIPVTGGGLCQLSNLIHWMLLHTGMTLLERHRHGYDAFPDYRRTVPFGSGATIFFNYHDLIFRNESEQKYQINIWFDEEYINGEITSDSEAAQDVRIIERKHRFVCRNGVIYRENELWRIHSDRNTGETVEEKLIMNNKAEVRYDPLVISGVEIEED